MASDLACDNRKMESAFNALPFTSPCANRYWKAERGCWLPSLRIFTSPWRWMIAKSELSGKHNAPQSYTFMPDNLWLGVIALIPLARRTAVCTLKASGENCVRAQRCVGAIFHKWHLFPSSHPLDLWRRATTLRALSDVFEQLPSARPRWAVQLSSDLFRMAPWY